MTSADPRIVATRADVHEAVVRILHEEGPTAVNHRRVAEVAGVSRATMYRHWPDRHTLLIDTMQAQEHAGIEFPEPTGDLEADLVALLCRIASVMMTMDAMPWFVAMATRADEDPDLAAARDELAAFRSTPLAPILEDAIARGDLPDDLHRELAGAELVGPLFALRFVRGQDLTDDLVRRHVHHWLHGATTSR